MGSADGAARLDPNGGRPAVGSGPPSRPRIAVEGQRPRVWDPADKVRGRRGGQTRPRTAYPSPNIWWGLYRGPYGVATRGKFAGGIGCGIVSRAGHVPALGTPPAGAGSQVIPAGHTRRTGTAPAAGGVGGP